MHVSAVFKTEAREKEMAESILDKIKRPPAAVLLGWRLIDVNLEEKRIKVGFDGKPEFLNPVGNIHGGILAAMLDDTMGPLVVAVTNLELFPATINLNVSFIRPVRPGPICATAVITNMGKQLVFLEAQLFDADGALCARAVASSVLVKASALKDLLV
jgi:uncharacterized protein (TIGR00369 family)